MRLYSIIIPVYNRPDELDDLLSSLCKQTYVHFEVIVVEDGSEIPAKEIVGRYQGRLDLHYYVISNSGPGMARNHGARQARGEYLLILDSDVVLPSTWLEHIHDSLNHYPVDTFGGPDKAHASFSPIQKAINYAMTSFLTTGGIRGGKKKLDKFYHGCYGSVQCTVLRSEPDPGEDSTEYDGNGSRSVPYASVRNG